MNETFKKIVNNFDQLSFFNKKTSEKFVLDFLDNKYQYIKILEENISLLKNIEICLKCNSIKIVGKCQNCEYKFKKIYLFDNLTDYLALSKNMEDIEKVFILDFSRKTDYLNKDKLNENITKFYNFFTDNQITEEIIFMLSPSFETEIVKKTFKNEIITKSKSKIIFKEIPLGLPLNTKIKYYDPQLLKGLINKNEI